MTKQAAISVHASTALHVGVLVAVLAWSSLSSELPHYHLQRGTITLQASFAAPEPASEPAAVVLLSPAETESPQRPMEAAELAPAAMELRPARTSLETSLAQVKLPAELEACDCDAPEHKLQTPPRKSAVEPQAVAPTVEPPQIRRAEAVTEFTVASAVSLPSSPEPFGTDVDEPPRKIATNRPPPYPPDAFQRGQEGRVLLAVQITAEGAVKSLRVIESSGVASLDQSALDTVAGWRFEPARRGGRAVEAAVNVPVRFTIRSY